MGLWIGVACAVVGNIVNSISFQIQRYVHANNVNRVSYIMIPLWWCGLACMVAGEVGNFAAYGMAPASLVSQLGAVAVILNAVLSSVFLKEKISYTGVAGVVCALVGTILVILSAPKSTGDLLIYDCIVSWQGLGLLIFVLMCLWYIANPLNMSTAISTEYAAKHVVFYCAVCSLLGAITVASAKGVSTAVGQLAAGDSTLFIDRDTAWLTYALTLSLVSSTVLQVIYLNTALMHFGASVVVPVYYVLFTSASIATGMILFRETVFDVLVRDALLFAAGVLLAFGGVCLMNHQEAARVQAEQLIGVEAGRLQASFRTLEVRNYMRRLSQVRLVCNPSTLA